MILEYHRPETIEEALALIARPNPRTVPLGGGTMVSGWRRQDIAVVDLQALPLDAVESGDNALHIGATARLASLAANEDIPGELRRVILESDSTNHRNAATLGGTLVSADGRSALAAALMALDAELLWQPGNLKVSLGNYYPLRSTYQGHLLIRATIPLNAMLRVEKVSRSPADWPLLVVAACRWPSGRTRIAVGGFGLAPVLALDGPDATGAVPAVRTACEGATDEWASGVYRTDVAAQLTRRLMAQLSGEGAAQ